MRTADNSRAIMDGRQSGSSTVTIVRGGKNVKVDPNECMSMSDFGKLQ